MVRVILREELIEADISAHDTITVDVHHKLVLGLVLPRALRMAEDVPVRRHEPVLGLVPVGGPHHERRDVLPLGELALVDVDGEPGPAVHDAHVLGTAVVRDGTPGPLLVVRAGEGLQGDLAAESIGC